MSIRQCLKCGVEFVAGDRRILYCPQHRRIRKARRKDITKAKVVGIEPQPTDVLKVMPPHSTQVVLMQRCEFERKEREGDW